MDKNKNEKRYGLAFLKWNVRFDNEPALKVQWSEAPSPFGETHMPTMVGQATCPVAQPPTRVGLDPKDPSTLHALGSLNGTVHTTFRCGRIIHRSLFHASENVSDYSLLLPCGMGREDLDPLLTLLPLCHALGLLIGTGQFVARENV